MLFFALKRMIERSKIEGIEEKIDIFFAASKLNKEEYDELIKMLHPENRDGLI